MAPPSLRPRSSRPSALSTSTPKSQTLKHALHQSAARRTPEKPPPPPSSTSRYFLIIASRNHVRAALEGAFCQANHGKKEPLQRMRKGDGVVFYSARETYEPNRKLLSKSKSNCGAESTVRAGGGKGDVCQRFTAIGRVSGDEVYQVQLEGWEPWRRDVRFLDMKAVEKKGVDREGGLGKEAPIAPLIERLAFIRDKKNWGASLRFGFVKIGESDWEVIQGAMTGL